MWLKYLQKLDYWLLGLTAALAVLHLATLDRADKQNLLSLAFLFWLAIASLLWDKRRELKLDSDPLSTIIGFLLISLILLRGLSPAGYHLLVSPALAGVGVALMASGIKGLKQYWKELSLLALLASYSLIDGILQAIDLPLWTAKLSTLLLAIFGYDVYREGVIITLPTGRVEVYGSCSGIESLILMLSIAVIFFLLFPIPNIHKIISIFVALVFGFVVNCGRVALMAVLVAARNTESFEFWHGDEGSLVFSMISVFLFGIFCWFFYIRSLSADGSFHE